MARQQVLITGATDGIGLALAQIYLARGVRVIAVGRRPASAIPAVLRSDYCRVDLTQPFAATLVAALLRQRHVHTLDQLIHCAGVGSYGPLMVQTPAELDALLQTNLYAPIALTHALLPLLSAAQGRIVFIGSVAAGLPVPAYAVYGATKAALEGFARSLRVELAGHVMVQVIHPGATRTAMHRKVGAPLDQIGWQRFPPPERVARQLVRASERGTAVATLGAGNRLIRFAGIYLGKSVERVIRTRTIRQASTPAQPPVVAPPQGVCHCVVTGGADGIGRAIAERYATEGWTVTLIDRDRARADETARVMRAQGAAVTVIEADLIQAADRDRALQQLADLPAADVFVHSAGISLVGRFAQSDLTRQQTVLELNLHAPMHLTAGLLRHNLLAPGATLVMIASLSVYTGYPGAAVYAASKDGLSAYARSLRVALSPQGLNVLTVYPGPTRTAHARRYSPDNRRERRRMPPAHLANLIVAAVQRRATSLIPGSANRLLATSGRFFPSLTETLMQQAILKKLPVTGMLSNQE
ncbi:SDR family oxidoreductase [Candidatus Chloroploca sp. Khr17]|uniref:SDR family NAD(P)-dependent oxidoreductase n=1 Tax=Candidatus Chloroploca sp. Khr17 TaxID=2496869 RepID=UPI00101C8E20|nr:SDR family NAD(P)-dependent oxidoreductase [Candidatus Chloroploca sp. Khr17]